ncbi:MAG: hypothetical protein ACLUFA_00455 [[Clostridium] leptum]
MSCFLGIDAGTSGVKAVVMDASGALLGKGRGVTDRTAQLVEQIQAWWRFRRRRRLQQKRPGEVAGTIFWPDGGLN